MWPEEYLRPRTLDEALTLLDNVREDGKIVAGGTDLVLALRRKIIKPRVLLDITAIPELADIRQEGERIQLGATATFTQLATSAVVRERANALAVACRAVGAPQIRNRGTLGGNLANASPAADTLPALLAYDGVVAIASRRGRREVSLDQFLLGPGRTVLASDELVTGIVIHPYQGNGGRFAKLGRRNALAIARINAAVDVAWDGDCIQRVRLVFGAVGPWPARATALENVLVGRRWSDELGRELQAAACRWVKNQLGARPSAVYKNQAVAGVVEQLFAGVAAGDNNGRCAP